jgi:outer membrane protein assembly factor BamB
MDISNLLFVGVNETVAAFNKHDGGLIWKTPLKASFLGDSFVTLLVEGERIFAHTQGQLFCLDASSGRQLWRNELKGLSYAIASLAIESTTAPSAAAHARHKRRKESERSGPPRRRRHHHSS